MNDYIAAAFAITTVSLGVLTFINIMWMNTIKSICDKWSVFFTMSEKTIKVNEDNIMLFGNGKPPEESDN